jgi:hypothetical protein
MHGNIHYLKLSWRINRREQAGVVTAAFAPQSLLGLEEVDLDSNVNVLEEVNVAMRGADNVLNAVNEARNEISHRIAMALAHALQGNQTIRQLRANGKLFRTTETFREFVIRVIPSMPSLELVDFKDMNMDGERASLILEAVEASDKLRKFSHSSWDENVSSGLVSAIRYECELNRIGLPHLLATDASFIPAALWPFILANIHELSTVFTLLREKNDILVHPGSGQTRRPDLCLGCMILW